MKRIKAGVASLIVLASFAAPVPAANPLVGNILSKGKAGTGVMLGGPVHLNADTLDYDDRTGVAIAEGNVELLFGNRSMRADRIRYDTRNGEAELAGRVHYKEMGDEFSFDRIVINIETELGVMYNGAILIGNNNYRISSERFEKIEARTYRILKGSITTCPCDPEPDWKFEVRRSEVTIDGYAVGKDVTFKVRGVPVLWLPWAAFPVKITRQSGFLLPNFSHSQSKGYSFQLPYYWAISRWSDATLTIEEMTRRGIRPDVEYRYVLNPFSEGEAHLSVHHDKETGDARYRAHGKNRYRDPAGWTSNAMWDFASDDSYYVDLVETDILRTGRHIPSRGFVGRGTGENYGALSAAWVKDVQYVPDDNTVQRLPEISGLFLPRAVGIGGIEAGGEVVATYFHREEGNREIRGRGFAELFRTFNLYPAVSFTPFVFLDLLGSDPVSDGNGTHSAGRTVPGGGGHIVADFRRVFEKEGGSRLVHLVQSDVLFRWVPSVEQKNIPLTDQWARIGEQRQFVFALTQRLLRVDNVAGPYELASLAVEWALDTGSRRPTGSPYLDPLSPFSRSLRDQIDLAAGRIGRQRDTASDVYARFLVRPSAPWSLTGETLFDTGSGKLTLAAIGTEWKRDKDTRAQIEYRISRDLSEDINGQFAVRPMRVFGLHTNMNYSIKNGQLTEGTATVTLHPRSECWSVGLMASRKTNPDESSYKIFFSLKGIGTLGD